MKRVIETTEFGMDMIRGLPKAYYYSKNKIPHKCIVKPTLVDLYKLVSDNVFPTNEFGINNPIDMYNYRRPSWTLSEWTPPPFKKMFKKKIKTNFDKPTIVINNRFAMEMSGVDCEKVLVKYPNLKKNMSEVILNQKSNQACVNHFGLKFLTKFINLFEEQFQIIYISPVYNETYFRDGNVVLQPNDFEYLNEQHPNVYTIKYHMEKYNLSYNDAQFELAATSDKHLTSLGGNCKVALYFGGDVVLYNSNLWLYGHSKGNRDMYKSGSWLEDLSGAKLIQKNSYKDILSYTEKNWKNS